MNSKIGKVEWLLLYIGAGLIDIFQWFFVVINPVADPIIGVFIAGYFQMLRGVSMITRPSRLASLVGVTAIEEISGGLAPAWIIDIWYIHRSVRQEEAEMQAAQEQALMLQNNTRRFRNRDGVRDDMRNNTEGQTNNEPLVKNRVRRAN